jgi:hypothetical protein
MPPHRYVSRRRLESAKAMIATGHASLGVPAGHGHDARRVPTNVDSIAGLRAIATTIVVLRTGAGFQCRRLGVILPRSLDQLSSEAG